MTSSTTNAHITVTCSTGKTAPGELVIETFSASQIALRATIRGVTGLIVTALMVFVPVAHFVFVPLGLIVTAALVFGAMSTKSRILSGQGACAECGNNVKIMTRPYRLPFNDVCEHCGRRVTISAAN